MARVLNRTTKEYLTSVSPRSAYPLADWFLNPDVSAVEGVWATRYWDTSNPSQAENVAIPVLGQAARDAIDAAILSDARDAVSNQLDELEDLIRALGLAVLDEFNVIREETYGSMAADGIDDTQSIGASFVQLAAMGLTTEGASSANTTVDTVAGTMNPAKVGDYMVGYSISFSGANNTEFDFAIFGNASQAAGTQVTRSLGTGGDIGVISGQTIVNIPATGIDLSIRARQNSGGSKNITVKAISLWAFRVEDRAPRTIAQLKAAVRGKLGT